MADRIPTLSPRNLKRFLAFLALGLVAAAAYAEVANDVWTALLNQNVIIVKNDGSEVAGKLTSVTDKTVVVIKPDGTVVSVTKTDAGSVRVATAGGATTSPAQTNVADVPLRPMYFQFDPLGFLQLGASAEFGFRVAPSTLVGLAVRFEGLGLLYQVINNGFENSVSPLSMAVEAVGYQLFNATGMNRWYLQGVVGYGWGTQSGTGSSGDWQERNSHLEFAVGGGYRWRFSSGFHLDAGGVAGVAPNLTDSWYYTSAPSVVYENPLRITFFGMLQLHVGWEI